MNPPKCKMEDYINFIMGSPQIFTCTEVAKVQEGVNNAPSHDSVNRLLNRDMDSITELHNEAMRFINLKSGVLILDDSTIDKPYAQHIELVSHHWSGKHHAVVKGINLLTLLWSDGDAHIPYDYRIYCKEHDKKTKNDHFDDMLSEAALQGFEPSYVLFDSWYSGLNNLKAIRKHGWHWFTRLKSNRLVNPDGSSNIQVCEASISESGTVVHLKGYGFIKVFRITDKNGSTEHWATDNIEMDDFRRIQLSDFSWRIEEYHRGLKQFCGVERSHVRLAMAQKNHICSSIRAFLRFEVFSLKTGISWFEAKYRIIRNSVRLYMANPIYVLPTA